MRGLTPVGLALLLSGCLFVKGPTYVDPVDEREIHAVNETSRYSGIAGQKVHGEISDKEYFPKTCPTSAPCVAFAWYVGEYGKGAKGAAVFSRTQLHREDIDERSISYASAHEVCHSVTGPDHDDPHAACTAKLHTGLNPKAVLVLDCGVVDFRHGDMPKVY